MLDLGLGSFGDDVDFVIAMFVISYLEMDMEGGDNMFCIWLAFAFFDVWG